ncbi:MAG TPA: single-stranded DNA-binding protein [Tangfeifania sp.]|nr:single-stranded DNA-binding protein [Tangfeifania sp.]
MSVNKVILVGNVGNDPEVKHLDQDVKVAKFRMATSETYRAKNGERVTSTEWHNIVLWRGLAGVVEQYVKKGSRLFIEGKLTHRQYEKDGETKFFTEVVANNMVMLDSKEQNRNEKESQDESYQSGGSNDFAAASEPEPEDQGGDDDLPF